MTDTKARYDGLGIAMLGLAALLLTGLSLSDFIRAPAPLDDTGVQQSMAWASWAMVTVSLAGGAIGAMSLYLIFRTLQAAQRSASAAEKTLTHAAQTAHAAQEMGRAQVRGYLIVSSAALEVSLHNQVVVRYAFQNAGQTPTTDVECTVQVRFETLDPEDGWTVIGWPYSETKNRSAIAPADTRSGRTEPIDPIEIAHPSETSENSAMVWAQTQRVIVKFVLAYRDVFGEQRAEPVFYGCEMNGLRRNSYTLYREKRADGEMVFDVFD